jgi:hypothetical protein
MPTAITLPYSLQTDSDSHPGGLSTETIEGETIYTISDSYLFDDLGDAYSPDDIW